MSQFPLGARGPSPAAMAVNTCPHGHVHIHYLDDDGLAICEVVLTPEQAVCLEQVLAAARASIAAKDLSKLDPATACAGHG